MSGAEVGRPARERPRHPYCATIRWIPDGVLAREAVQGGKVTGNVVLDLP